MKWESKEKKWKERAKDRAIYWWYKNNKTNRRNVNGKKIMDYFLLQHYVFSVILFNAF